MYMFRIPNDYIGVLNSHTTMSQLFNQILLRTIVQQQPFKFKANQTIFFTSYFHKIKFNVSNFK